MYPIGFDPCGAIFGAIRRPYSSPARFFADQSQGSNRIIWYFANPSAVFYPDANRFPPGIDFVAQNPPIQWERTGPSRALRKYIGYRFHEYFPGEHWDGTYQDFRGDTLKSVYMIGGGSPENPCGDPNLMAGIALGGRVDERVRPLDARFAIGGRVTQPDHCLDYSKGGIALGARVVTYHYCPGRNKGGIALGGVVHEPAVHLRGGIALGGVVTEPADLSEYMTGGIALGGVVTELEPTPILQFGLMLGGKVSEEPFIAGGIMLGARVQEPSFTSGITIDAATNNIWQDSILLIITGTFFVATPEDNEVTLIDSNGDPIIHKVVRVTGTTMMYIVMLFPERHVLGVVNARIHNSNGDSGPTPVNVATFVTHTIVELDHFTDTNGTDLASHTPDIFSATPPAYAYWFGGHLQIDGNKLRSDDYPIGTYKFLGTQTTKTMYVTIKRLTGGGFKLGFFRHETSGGATGSNILWSGAHEVLFNVQPNAYQLVKWEPEEEKRFTVQWNGAVVVATVGGAAQIGDAAGLFILKWALDLANYYSGTLQWSVDDLTAD